MTALSGNQKRRMRSAARFFAVQALFRMEASGQSVDRVMREFEDFRFGESFDDVTMEEGDIALVDIKEFLVYAELTGECAVCAGSSRTMKMMVEKTLKEWVDEQIKVIAL